MRIKFTEVIKKIIISIIILTILMPQVVSNAALTESQQKDVVSLCERLANMGILYDNDALTGDTHKSDLAYHGLQEAADGNIYMVCATYVSYVFKELFGIYLSGYNSTDAYFANGSGSENGCTTTTHNPANKPESHFEFVTDGNLQVGDVIVWRTGSTWIHGHIGIYLGGDRVTHCGVSTGVTITSLSEMESSWATRHCVLRISGSVESKPGGGNLGELIDAIQKFIYEKVVFRKANESSIDKNKTFAYQGIARADSQSTSNSTDLSNVDRGKSLGVFEITGYCACSECTSKENPDGVTASGAIATANHTIAVDPSVIPLGTTVLINGKEYTAEDTGGAIQGKRIDMYFNTHQEALNWGRQSIEVFMGDASGSSNGATDESWRFPTISSLLEWILSFIVTMIKAVFVGLTTIVHILVSYYVDAASGEDVSSRLSDGMMAYLDGGMREDLKNSISLEKIVYNKVPILDVNVFNGNIAGGETVDSGSLTMIIRNLVATLYMSIRQLSIIAMLIILIYLGIKLVTSTIAEQKAEYRKKLASWSIAFIIVFVMHYFLIGVMRANEILVNLLSDLGANIASQISGEQYTDLAMAMRDLTYNTAIVQSMLAMVMYMVMVYYLIKFIIIYFKRLFVTTILIIIGPFLAIKNAFDKVRFNKSSSMLTWAKEYIFSVGTQTIHALVYTIFISITYKIVLSSDTAKIAVCILACMFFRFMTIAEKMLRNMLRLAGGQVESIIGDVNSTDIKNLFGLAIIGKITKFGKNFNAPAIIKRKYEKGKEFFNDHLQSEYVKIKRDEYINKYKSAYMPDERGRRAYVTSDIDKKIDDVLRKEFEYKLKKTMGTISAGKQLAGGVLRIGIGATTAAVGSLIVGGPQVYVGVKTVGRILGMPIKGYKSTNKIIKYRAKDGTYKELRKWSDSNVVPEVADRLKKQYLYDKDDVTAQNELKLTTLHQARRVELELEQEIAIKKETLLKGTKQEATPLEKELSGKYTKELRKSVEDTMKTVDRKDIHKEVKDYMKKNNKYALTLKDFENIAEKFDVKVSGKIVDDKIQTEELMENVKSETMARFIREVTINDGISKEITIDEEAMDKVEENLKEKLDIAKEEEKPGILNAMKCIDDKRHEIQGKEKLHVYSNLNEEQQKQVNRVLADAVDEQVIEKQVPKLSREQIVDTMKKAINMEGTIKREQTITEFKPVIQKVEQLRDLDEIARENGQGPIYEDVGKLVETMINNTKVVNQKE